MTLQEPVTQILLQLKNVLNIITNNQYNTSIPTILNATIGEHTRHIIELFQELNKSYDSGFVNYENRKRNKELETNKNEALIAIDGIINSLNKTDKAINNISLFMVNNTQIISSSSYYRELVYNIEHTVHHLALIRVGLQALNVFTDASVGFSDATIKNKQACVQ